MSERKKSEAYFHMPPCNLNCAQSVLAGFQNEFEISDETIVAFAANGGGRAEGGYCGALFAANYLLAKRGLKPVNAEFAAVAGAERCRDIKGGTGYPCPKCVALADHLVAEAIGEE